MDSNFSHLADVDPQLVGWANSLNVFSISTRRTDIGKRSFLRRIARERSRRPRRLAVDLPRPPSRSFCADCGTTGSLPRDASELFHYIRRVGNAAIHENAVARGRPDRAQGRVAAWDLVPALVPRRADGPLRVRSNLRSRRSTRRPSYAPRSKNCARRFVKARARRSAGSEKLVKRS